MDICGEATFATSEGGLHLLQVQSFWQTCNWRLVRSCLKTQLDAPGIKGVPVPAIHDYCKCNASDLANKISNDEVRSLEATGSEEKYRTAMLSRLEASAKMCLEATLKSLSK